MDAYLDIAVAILRAEKRPLSPRAILAAAYQSGIVPPHLHGKTQEKTLQARISEDIVARRDQSLFFRTAPGRFFLREFLSDTSLPDEIRRPIPTRRRFRELLRGPALAIDHDVLRLAAEENVALWPQKICELLKSECYRYEDPRAQNTKSIFIRSFVCVRRDTDILTYRLGRYREDRDTFVRKRSIGFSTLIHMDEHNLFNLGDLGIVDSGVKAVKLDLDIPDVSGPGSVEASLSHFIWFRQAGASDLLAVIAYQCPKWFEPIKRRLALNDLKWMDYTTPPNDLDDFDPWSKTVLLDRYYRKGTVRCPDQVKNRNCWID